MARPDTWSSFESFVQSTMREHSIPGLSVAVMQNGQHLCSGGFGFRNRSEQEPATARTVYGIGSVTKSFAAMAIMILAGEGRLSVGDPVRKHLPEFSFGDGRVAEAVTVHHFLTHTSALPPTPALKFGMRSHFEAWASPGEMERVQELGLWDEWTGHPPIETHEHHMDFLKGFDEEPLGRPGQQFSYSNDAFSLLGAIVQRVSGQSFECFVKERILDRLQMEAGFHPSWLEGRADVTELYDTNPEGEAMEAGHWFHAPAMVSAGFLKTSVLDMLRYGQSYLDCSILQRGAISQMTAPLFPCGRDTYYGYGLRVHPNYGGTTVVEHGGSLKGIAAQFGFVPEEGIVAAVLANVKDVPVDKIWRGAINPLLGLPMETAWSRPPDCECTQEHLARYTGTYRSGEGAKVEVILEDGELFAMENSERKALRPTGADTVGIMRRGEETEIRFITGPLGHVDAMFYGLRILRRDR